MLKIASLDVLLGWGNVKNCIFGCASGWGNVKKYVSGCASGWGNVKNEKWNVLLAGEKLKKKMKCASGWGNVKNSFGNVLLTGESLKKLKMLKMGGTMFVHKASIHKHGSPHF